MAFVLPLAILGSSVSGFIMGYYYPQTGSDINKLEPHKSIERVSSTNSITSTTSNISNTSSKNISQSVTRNSSFADLTDNISDQYSETFEGAFGVVFKDFKEIKENNPRQKINSELVSFKKSSLKKVNSDENLKNTGDKLDKNLDNELRKKLDNMSLLDKIKIDLQSRRSIIKSHNN